MPPGERPPPPRPPIVNLAAGILVLGGLVGFGRLAAGEYVVTGSLPAKDPIVGVAFIAYGTAIALGLGVRAGRAWLATLNFAAATVLLYLPAARHPTVLALVLSHALAAAVLVGQRPWFEAMRAWRRGALDIVADGDVN